MNKKNLFKHIESIKNRFAWFLTEKPIASSVSAFFLMIVLILGVRYLRADYNSRIWFKKSDPLIQRLDSFERQFGNDETMVLALYSPSGIFDKDSIELLKTITDKMWRVEDIIRVDSLINFSWIESENDDIKIEAFFPEDKPLNESFIALRKKEAMSHEVIPGYLISQDGKSAMVFGRLKPSFGEPPNYKKIAADVKKIIEDHDHISDHRIYMAGSGAVSDAFREVSESDLATILPILLMSIIFFLFINFKTASGITLPLVIIFSTMAITFGVSGWLEIKFNNMLSLLPGILLAIAIADSVHILVTFMQYRREGENRKLAAISTINKNFKPTLLTSISTTIGFFSLIPTDLVPVKHLGILAGVGTLAAWATTFLLLIPLMVLLPIKFERKKSKVEPTYLEMAKRKRKMGRVIRLINIGKKPIMLGFGIFAIVALILGSMTDINSNPFDYFSKDLPLKKAHSFIRDNFGGTAGPEIVISSGQENGIKEPEFLKKVEILQKWLNDNPHVNKVISIVDILKQLNRSLHNDDPKFFKLPSSKNAIAEELFLYTMSLPEGVDLKDRMTLQQDAMRMTVLWDIADSKKFLEEIDKIEAKAKEIGLNAVVTGKAPLYQRMNGYVVKTFFTSMILALFFISLLMTIVFNSLKLGLISMIPNLFPIIFGGALMRLLDISFDVSTSLVCSVCMGIVVDDTIHFLCSYQNGLKNEKTTEASLVDTLSKTAPALIITTMILVAGFGVFIFADFMPNVNFGILCSFILTMALVADFLLLPAVLMSLKGVEAADVINEVKIFLENPRFYKYSDFVEMYGLALRKRRRANT